MTASRNSTVLVSLCCALGVVLTGCVTPSENTAATGAEPALSSSAESNLDTSPPSPMAKVVEEPAESSSSSTTLAPPPTIVLPENTPETADELAEAVNIPSNQFPSAYKLDDVDDDEPFCVDVEATDVARTPIGRSERRAQGSHLVSVSTYVYADDDTAIDSIEYARTMFERCNEAYVDDTPGAEVLAYHRIIEPVDMPDTIDELVSVDSSFSNTTETRFVYGDVGRSGSIVFVAATTDPDLLPQLTQRIADRVDGLATSGSLLVPRGTQDVGPGLGDATYWSWEDGPKSLREADFASSEAQAFVDASTDLRLDQLAGSGCASIWTYTTADDIASLSLSLFSEAELETYGGDISEVATAAMALYCPGFHEFYLAELTAAE